MHTKQSGPVQSEFWGWVKPGVEVGDQWVKPGDGNWKIM